MKFSDEVRSYVIDKTGGRCHICRRPLAWSNYGRHGSRGAWEVDHSIALANGGTNRLNNLYPACTSCNRSKGKGSTRRSRAQYGHRRAPMSLEAQDAARANNMIVGGIFGLLLEVIYEQKISGRYSVPSAFAGLCWDPE